VNSLSAVSIALVVLLVAYLFLLLSLGIGLLRARRIARSRTTTEQAVQAMGTWLAVAVTSREPQRVHRARAAVRNRLTALTTGEQRMALFVLARNVTGEGIIVLRELSEELGIRARIESETTSRVWHRRLLAVRLMAALEVRDPRIRDLLDDPNPTVRAQCVQWATADPTPANLERLAEMVEDPDDRCRFEARDALTRLGVVAAGTVLDMLRSDRPRRVDTGLRIASLARDPGYTETLRSFLRTGTPEQQVLAAASLSAADPAALRTLHRLICHTDPTIRLAAVEVLAEDKDWHQATVIAPLLADPSHTVRRAAGLALLRLGAPGLIMLRRGAAEATTVPGRADSSGHVERADRAVGRDGPQESWAGKRS
jgi:lambda repressor-like predicted transcriptional regulator